MNAGTLVRATYTGISFEYHVARGVVGAIDEADEAAWKTAVREENRGIFSNCFPVQYTLPCGNVARYETLDDVPMEDVPCPCGDPTHWFVQYRCRGE